MNKRLSADEMAEVLGVEKSRFRFLEVHCQDFLSPSRMEIPRKYSMGDLKILEAANLLLSDGVAPGAVKAQLATRLANPGWTAAVETKLTPESKPAKLIAVASGKGGVGKSSIALNLGIELVGAGLRTAVMDGDLGVANLHLMAGLKAGPTLKDVISGRCTIEDAIAGIPHGPDVIPGSSGVYELANLSAPKRRMLLDELKKLERRYDIILIDTAAGVAGAVLDFVVSSDFVLVVTTAENTAIADAYALIKLTLERDPCCEIGVVANRVRSAAEGAHTVGRISDCTRRFLRRGMHELGWIWESSQVRSAVNDRVPFVQSYPQSRAAVSIRKLARVLLDKGIASPRPAQTQAGFQSFAERCSSTGAGTTKVAQWS